MNDVLSKVSSLKDNKNLPIILIGAVIFIVCIIIIIYFSFFYGGNSYSDIREEMEEAAVSYCEDNCDKLFEGVNTVTVSAQTLISGEYMKDFSKLTNDKDNNCSGEVIINKSYSGYNYISNLSCGDDYSDKKIVDYINSNNDIVTSGSGLYEMNDSKVYRGEYVSNYLQLGTKDDSTMFRIVKINSDNTLMLVLADYNKNTSYSWDDRYNSTTSKTDGINDYSVSRALEKLDGFLEDSYKSISDNALLYDYCIGSRTEDASDNSGSIECATKYSDYISMIPVYDYLNASLDSSCKSVSSSMGCKNYNYLASYGDDMSFWTITSVSDTTNKAFYYDGSSLDSYKVKTKGSLRFVITISGDEVYKSGTGTEDDPYKIY